MTASSFDDRAATWDDDAKTARARSVAATIREAAAPDRDTRLLEYGAGTGLVAQFLAEAVGSVTLADSSQGMRTVAGEKVEAGVLPPTTRIWDLDLQSSEPPNETFDLIVAVMALHHVPDVPTVLSKMAAMLADDGRLCVVDLEAEDGSFHDEASGPVHSGFDERSLTAMFADAGLRMHYVHGIYDVMKDERPYPLFLAVGTRD